MPQAGDATTPTLFRAGSQDDAERLAALRREGLVFSTHDDLSSQIAELIETRNADRKFSADELATRVRDHAPDLSRYGNWVFYPWSGCLVHVLAEAEFEEVRTSRNRNKITREEQTKLARLRVGIAGLSVGQSTAITLALEGIGGHFRLADFDTLSLSNMNRLRAGVHQIGVKKTTIVAREIFEINPYARVEVFDRGITDETLEPFFGDEGSRLDLLFEECDDLRMKFKLREAARSRRIAVLMETSDRGLFDVERFDKEPARTLFHGLVGAIDADSLKGLTTYQKVPIVLDIIGARTMSARMAASLVDIDATLRTWPQLASAVALGGAINADAARRIALGKFSSSGRFFVDLEQLVSDSANPSIERGPGPTAPKEPTVARDGTATPVAKSPPAESTRKASADLLPSSRLTGDELRELVRLASLAPSGGNCQPWRFELGAKSGVLRCYHEPERSRGLLDFENRATFVAFGALAESLSIAARTKGIGLDIREFPSSDPLLVCEARFEGRREPEADSHAAWLDKRVTNRKLGQRTAVTSDDLASLGRALERGPTGTEARIDWLTANEELEKMGMIIGLGERIRLLSATMHSEMMHEIRWTRDDTERTRDGLDLATLEMTPTDRAGMQIVSSWKIMSVEREIDGGHGLAEPSRKAVRAASAVGVLSVGRAANDGDVRSSYFRGGRALNRLWLEATSRRFAFQPMTPLVYLFARLEQGHGVGLDEREKTELGKLRAQYLELLPSLGKGNARTEIMLFRLARAEPPMARSLRRSVDDMLQIVDS